MRMLLLSAAAVLLIAPTLHAEEMFLDDFRALVCMVALKHGHLCTDEDFAALERVNKRESDHIVRAKAEKAKRQKVLALPSSPH
jgi:hypothetical protein